MEAHSAGGVHGGRGGEEVIKGDDEEDRGFGRQYETEVHADTLSGIGRGALRDGPRGGCGGEKAVPFQIRRR